MNYEKLWRSAIRPPSRHSWQAQPLLMSWLAGLRRPWAFASGLATVLAPFALIGGWLRWRDPRFGRLRLRAIFLAASVLPGPSTPMAPSSIRRRAAAAYVCADLLGVEALAISWPTGARAGRCSGQHHVTSAAIAVSVLPPIQTIRRCACGNDQTVRQQAETLTGAAAGERLMSGDSGAYDISGDRPGVARPTIRCR
jgi:hypothetical protein